MTDRDDPRRIVLNILPSRCRSRVYEVAREYDRHSEEWKYTVAKQILDGLHFRSRELIDLDRSQTFSSRVVDRAALADIYAALATLSIPLHPQFAIGRDGTYHHLRIEGHSSYVAIHFWSGLRGSELRPVFEFQHALANKIDSLTR